MKICMVVHQYPPERFGGAERHVQQLAAALSSRHEILIYTQTADPRSLGAPEDAAAPVRVRRWTNRSIAAQPALAKDHIATCELFSPDVIHVHHAIGFPPRAILELTRRYPCVLTLHDYWWICARIRLLFKGDTPCDGPRPISKCVKCFRGGADFLLGEAAGLLDAGPLAQLVRSARKRMTGALASAPGAPRTVLAGALDLAVFRRLFFGRRSAAHKKILYGFKATISPSKYLLKRYAEAGIRFGAGPPRVVPYGVDPAESPGVRCGPVRLPIRFGIVGHLNREKGLPLAIRAFRNIDPGLAELHVHGAADLSPTLEQDAARSPVVRFHGSFDPARLAEILAGIDVLIAPSIWVENAPKTVSEAHAAGVPVLAADHGALPECTGVGRGGWLFHALDALSLEAAVRRLAEHPEDIERARASIPPTAFAGEIAAEIEKIYSDARSRH